MNQKKIGEFIALLRKEKGLSQAEFGDMLGVTNKTVSRWETGKYMPDLSIIPDLCNVLNIGINEFIAGERIDVKNFCKQADTNILELLQNNNILYKQKILSEVFNGGGTGLVLSVLYAPDTIKKAIIVIAGCIFIGLGWYIRTTIEKTKITFK